MAARFAVSVDDILFWNPDLASNVSRSARPPRSCYPGRVTFTCSQGLFFGSTAFAVLALRFLSSNTMFHILFSVFVLPLDVTSCACHDRDRVPRATDVVKHFSGRRDSLYWSTSQFVFFRIFAVREAPERS